MQKKLIDVVEELLMLKLFFIYAICNYKIIIIIIIKWIKEKTEKPAVSDPDEERDGRDRL